MRRLTDQELQQIAERREILISAGFHVCAGPVWHSNQPIWHVWSETAACADHLLVSLITGSWCRSRRSEWSGWKSWERGPWNELAEDEPNGQQASTDQPVAHSACPRSGVIAPDFTPDGRPVKRCFEMSDLVFFEQCVAAGLRITQPAPQLLDGDIDLGNRDAEYQGHSYLLGCRTRSIIGLWLRQYDLADFRAGLSPAEMIPDRHLSGHVYSQRLATPARPVETVRPRRQLSSTNVIVHSSGKTLQKGLF